MSDYEVREGIVIKTEAGVAVVRVDSTGEDCGGCTSCAAKSLCRGRDSGHMDLPVQLSGDTLTPLVGDRVRIAYAPPNRALAAIVLFLPTLAGLALGGYLAAGAYPGSDALFLAGCGVGLVAGLAVTWLLSRASSLFSIKTSLLPGGGRDF